MPKIQFEQTDGREKQMKVKELIDQLKTCNPDAIVSVSNTPRKVSYLVQCLDRGDEVLITTPAVLDDKLPRTSMSILFGERTND